MQTNTNNVTKARAFLQTTGGKAEPNIVLMRKSQYYRGVQNKRFISHVQGKIRLLILQKM